MQHGAKRRDPASGYVSMVSAPSLLYVLTTILRKFIFRGVILQIRKYTKEDECFNEND